MEYLRRDAVCPRCGAFERHRALASFYPRFFASRRLRARRLIHVAAEPCLAPTLRQVCDAYETSAFGDPVAADHRLDLTAIALPDASCDVLVMNHVLDCMPRDRDAVREMFRVLRPHGVVLAVVTYQPAGATRELPITSNMRHRVYGPDDLQDRFAPFDLAVENAAEDLADDARAAAAIPAVVPVLVLDKR